MQNAIECLKTVSNYISSIEHVISKLKKENIIMELHNGHRNIVEIGKMLKRK